MGGGGTNTGMTTPGGMQIYNSLGYDPSQPQGGGMNWGSMIGGGLQSFGKGMTSGAGGAPAAGDVPQLGAPQIYGEQPQQPVVIPQNNLLDALMRILSGG